MNENEILQHIEQNKSDYIQFLQKLIRTDSYNPPGNEKNAAKVIGEYLEKAQISYEIFPFEENRANLIAYLNTNTANKNLLYNGHMDIVPPGDMKEWKHSPLSGEIRDDIIYGRGTVDMKAGLAAMIISLKILKELNLTVSGNLILNAVSDEETGGFKGTKWMLDNKLKDIKIDFTIIGEPTRMKPLPIAILLGEKGHLLVKIITKGKSCHSSMPTLGKNAIKMMNRYLVDLDKIDKYIPETSPPIEMSQLKKLVEGSLPKGLSINDISDKYTLLKDLLESLINYSRNVTIIKGGIKENVIPDHCESVIDFRLLPGQSPETIVIALKKLAKDLNFDISKNNAEILEGEIEFNVILKTGASYWKDWKNSNSLNLLYDTIKATFGENPLYFLFPASSDARLLRNSGKCEQTILFGPGNATTAHSTDENIEVEEFVKAIKAYTIFAYKFLR